MRSQQAASRLRAAMEAAAQRSHSYPVQTADDEITTQLQPLSGKSDGGCAGTVPLDGAVLDDQDDTTKQRSPTDTTKVILGNALLVLGVVLLVLLLGHSMVPQVDLSQEALRSTPVAAPASTLQDTVPPWPP